MVSEKRKLAQAQWDKEHTSKFTIKLNEHTDADIIAKLNAQPSKAGYMKQLIREDIKKAGS